MKSGDIGERRNFRILAFSLVIKLAPTIVIITAIILFFNKLIFSRLVLARGDIYLYFYPYWQAASQALQSGRLPLWNPNLFMGAPFLANSQVGFFYPINWPFWLLMPAHYAISASIIVHIFIGAIGAYLACRTCLSLSRGPAIFSALMFGLGGYLTAQVEHVNQIQGMVWLPWFLFVICRWYPTPGKWREFTKLTLALALLFSLQLLSGHTQTFFITGVGMLLWLGARSFLEGSEPHIESKHIFPRLGLAIIRLIYVTLPLLIGGLIAILIAGVQLIPTLELASQSSRQQGLPVNEVLSFSLNPLVLIKSLLPLYEQTLFSEYVTMLPLTALFLAVIGISVKRKEPIVKVLIVLLIVSIFLAFGLFNPFYHLLARLPGFDLFRAPARWLILYALAVAMLGGLGLQVILEKVRDENPARFLRLPLIVSLILLSTLVIWGFLVESISSFVPVGAEITVESPNIESIFAWLIELALVALLIFGLGLIRNRKNLVVAGIALLALMSLFVASRSFSYAEPTTPEAYDDLRPPVTRLWAGENCTITEANCQQPPARFLSLSDIFFDVGDQPEIDTIYSDQLSEDAQYDYTIAIKQKEIIGPNLALAYDLSSVDGFDGGVLPLQSYTELISLLLPQDQISTDGRLREYLTTIPEDRWMDLFNTRYIITDKVSDAWRNGLFFDLQHNRTLSPGEQPASIGYLPSYEATEIWALTESMPGPVEIETIDSLKWTLHPNQVEPDLFRFIFPNPAVLKSIRFLPCDPLLDGGCQDSFQLKGSVLADSRDESFNPLVMGNYRLIHSGDVKIYENLDVLPRSFVVHEWLSRADIESSIEFMKSPAFEPAKSAVIVSDVSPSQNLNGESSVRIVDYQPERISIQVDGNSSGLLVITDAYYPGWEATIDGNATDIFQTNVLFRGIMVPAGEHEVELFFNPTSVIIGRAVSAAGLIIWILIAGILFYVARFRR